MKVDITNLEEGDIESISKILRKMWIMHTNSDLISKEKLEAMDVEDYIKKSLKDQSQVFFIAKINNEIAGVVRCEIKKTLYFYKEPNEAYIDDLVVPEKFRRKGIATSLTKACIEWAKKRNVHLITCKIWEFNKPSFSLIEKLGLKRDYSFYSIQV